MTVIGKKKIEGCIAGTNVLDLLLSDSTSREFILYLEKYGKLVYHENAPKPFFTLIVRGLFTIKGAQGNSTIRILMPDKNTDEILDEIYLIIEKYDF